MRTILTVIAGMLCVATLQVTALAAGPQVGDSPNLTIKTQDGQLINLSDLRGKIVVVDFWASWCNPCMAEAPKIADAYQANVNKGVVFLGVSLDEDPSAMKKAATDKGLVWPQAMDVGNKIASAWGIETIPQTVIISPDGVVLWRTHPGMGLAAAIDDAVQKHPPLVTDPKTFAAASTALDQAEQAIGIKDYPTAMKAMAQFPEAAAKEIKLADRLTTVRAQLDAAATQMLADVDALIDKKQYSDAEKQLRSMLASLHGTPTGTKISDKLQSLLSDPAAKAAIDAQAKEAHATEALAAAQKLQADKDDVHAYPAFKNIVAQYPGTAAATTAADAVKTYEADTALMARINDASISAKAKSMLSMAANYAQNGLTDRARAKYQEVIDAYPGTPYATQATKAIADLPSN